MVTTIGTELLASSVIGQRMYLEMYHLFQDPLITTLAKKLTSIGLQVCRHSVTLRGVLHSVETSEKWRQYLLPASTRKRISGETTRLHLCLRAREIDSDQTRSNQLLNQKQIDTSPTT